VVKTITSLVFSHSGSVSVCWECLCVYVCVCHLLHAEGIELAACYRHFDHTRGKSQ